MICYECKKDITNQPNQYVLDGSIFKRGRMFFHAKKCFDQWCERPFHLMGAGQSWAI